MSIINFKSNVDFFFLYQFLQCKKLYRVTLSQKILN